MKYDSSTVPVVVASNPLVGVWEYVREFGIRVRPSLIRKFEQQKQFCNTDLSVTFDITVLIVKPDNLVNHVSQMENVRSSQDGILVFNKTRFPLFSIS